MRRRFLRYASGVLLQNATKVYYKMRHILTAKCESPITKCDSYHKMKWFYYKM